MQTAAQAARAASAVPATAPLPLRLKLLYGAGEMPITMTMVLFGLFALFFYNSVMGLPAPLVGAGAASGLALDALLDPYVGHRSDGCRHAWGRRHAFMLPGALLMGPCFFLLFSPPHALGRLGLFVWLVLCSLAFRAASALYRIPYLSLGAELVQGYDERTNVMGIRALFGLLGTLAAAGLSFPLLGTRIEYGRYPRLGLLFGAAMSATGLLTVFGTWDRRAGPAAGAPAHAGWRHFFFQLSSSLRSRSFRAIWCSTTLFFLAVVVNAALAVHYFTWYARIGKGATVGGIQASFYLGAVAGVIIWMALARRSEKRGLYLTAMLGTAALLGMASLLVGPGHLFGTGHALPLVAGHAAAGLFASALWVVPPSMIADVADEDALAGGARREGIFYGMQNFGEKIASGGALLIAGTLLSVFVKLAPASAVQSPAAVTRLGLLYGLLPGALLIAAAALIFPYQLTRRRVGEIQRSLAAGENRG